MEALLGVATPEPKATLLFDSFYGPDVTPFLLQATNQDLVPTRHFFYIRGTAVCSLSKAPPVKT